MRKSDGMDFATLIRNIRSGDVASYEPIVADSQGWLRAFIAAYCPDRAQVDELVQRVFVWAFEHLGQCRSPQRFRGWLKAIARNTLLAHLEAQRRQTRNRKRYLEYLQATSCRDGLEADADDEQAGRIEALHACLDELPDASRRLIRRRYERPEAIAQIARDLNRSAGGVKVSLFRIRQALRKCIEGRLASAQD